MGPFSFLSTQKCIGRLRDAARNAIDRSPGRAEGRLGRGCAREAGGLQLHQPSGCQGPAMPLGAPLTLTLRELGIPGGRLWVLRAGARTVGHAALRAVQSEVRRRRGLYCAHAFAFASSRRRCGSQSAPCGAARGRARGTDTLLLLLLLLLRSRRGRCRRSWRRTPPWRSCTPRATACSQPVWRRWERPSSPTPASGSVALVAQAGACR